MSAADAAAGAGGENRGEHSAVAASRRGKRLPRRRGADTCESGIDAAIDIVWRVDFSAQESEAPLAEAFECSETIVRSADLKVSPGQAARLSARLAPLRRVFLSRHMLEAADLVSHLADAIAIAAGVAGVASSSAA